MTADATILTARQVADRWQCSPQHVGRLAKRGELHPLRVVGSHYRFTLAEIEAFEARMATAPESAPEIAPLPSRPARAKKTQPVGGMDGLAVIRGPVPWRSEVIS